MSCFSLLAAYLICDTLKCIERHGLHASLHCLVLKLVLDELIQYVSGLDELIEFVSGAMCPWED